MPGGVGDSCKPSDGKIFGCGVTSDRPCGGVRHGGFSDGLWICYDRHASGEGWASRKELVDLSETLIFYVVCRVRLQPVNRPEASPR